MRVNYLWINLKEDVLLLNLFHVHTSHHVLSLVVSDSYVSLSIFTSLKLVGSMALPFLT
jgi:hypothetical protein